MTVKLNLTVEQQNARFAKIYAKKKNTSVSKIFNSYLASLAEKENPKEKKEKTWVEKYAGIAKGKLTDIDKIRDEYLMKKYGM